MIMFNKYCKLEYQIYQFILLIKHTLDHEPMEIKRRKIRLLKQFVLPAKGRLLLEPLPPTKMSSPLGGAHYTASPLSPSHNYYRAFFLPARGPSPGDYSSSLT